MKGANIQSQRIPMWTDLQGIASAHTNLPWLVMGDFNTVRFTDEKLGGKPITFNKLKEFNDCIDFCSLSDMRCTGNRWSWHNKIQDYGRITGRLDRMLCNDVWLDILPNACYEYLSKSTSDHSPMILHWFQKTTPNPKPFKFYTSWMKCQ